MSARKELPAPGGRAARPPARDRARPPGHRLGPLGADRGPDGPHGLRLALPLLVPLRGRGHRERARHRRRAAGLQPLGRAAARRGDDHQGDQGGARPPAAAAPHRRALLQGLSGLQHARGQDRRRARPPGQRAPPAGRRGAARARLPRGPQGHGEALQGPLQAAPLRPRRLRRGGDARAGADRARGGRRGGGGDADLRPRQRAPAPHRAAVLPDHADLPAPRPGRLRSATCPPSSRSASWSPSRPTSGARSRGRTAGSSRPSPTRSARASRRS